jgi:hypothetical protein
MFLKHFDAGVFGRGLLSDYDFNAPAVTRVFFSVPCMSLVLDTDFATNDYQRNVSTLY